MSDTINHPSHYAEGRKYEPIKVIKDWDLNFNLGNAVKYISRAGRKDDIVQDLEKARFYLNAEIEYLNEQRQQANKCEYEKNGHCTLNECIYFDEWWDMNDEPHGEPYCYKPDYVKLDKKKGRQQA